MTEPFGKEDEKLNRPFRAFGVLCIGGALLYAFGLVFNIDSTVKAFRSGALAPDGLSTIVVTFLHLAVLVALALVFVGLGLRLLAGQRRFAAQAANAIIVLLLFDGLCSVMLHGVRIDLAVIGGAAAAAVVFRTCIDPALAQERRLQRKLRSMDERDEQEEGTLGRDESGKGYLALNFFNLFWIFAVCSVLGLALETIFHALQFHDYQDRAGLLFGPFSPIYGTGALLMTLALNRFYRANPVIVFFASAVIGGAFEYCASWFMQFAFGAVAWDYSGMWLSIGGRTCGLFMCAWGLLGVLWIKALLPLTLHAVNLIPWNWRYPLTVVCAALMAADIVMTLQALDCWYERLSGIEPVSPIQRFYARYFDDAFMADRFQSMSIHPENAVRGS